MNCALANQSAEGPDPADLVETARAIPGLRQEPTACQHRRQAVGVKRQRPARDLTGSVWWAKHAS